MKVKIIARTRIKRGHKREITSKLKEECIVVSQHTTNYYFTKTEDKYTAGINITGWDLTIKAFAYISYDDICGSPSRVTPITKAREAAVDLVSIFRYTEIVSGVKSTNFIFEITFEKSDDYEWPNLTSIGSVITKDGEEDGKLTIYYNGVKPIIGRCLLEVEDLRGVHSPNTHPPRDIKIANYMFYSSEYVSYTWISPIIPIQRLVMSDYVKMFFDTITGEKYNALSENILVSHNKMTYRCSECNQLLVSHINNITTLNTVEVICPKCVSKINIGACIICGYVSKLTKGACKGCRSMFVNLAGYNTKPANPITKEADMLVGIENELTSEYYYNNQSELTCLMQELVCKFGYFWTCTEDGSVPYCLEWTSRASNANTLPDKLDEFVKSDIGLEHYKAGLHVTFEKGIMKPIRWAKLVLLLTKYPEYFYKLMGRDIDNHYGVVDRYASIPRMTTGISMANRLKRITNFVICGNDKYSGVRFKNKLAEIRFPASANDKKLAIRVEYIIALVSYAMIANLDNGFTLGKLDNYIKDNASKYPRAKKLVV